jgi:hypothetical protein
MPPAEAAEALDALAREEYVPLEHDSTMLNRVSDASST